MAAKRYDGDRYSGNAGRNGNTGRGTQPRSHVAANNRDSRQYDDGFRYNSRNGMDGRNSRGSQQMQFEDVSSYSVESGYSKGRKKKKHTGLKVFVAIMSVLVILLGSGFLFLTQYLLGGMTTEGITKNLEELGIEPDNVYEAEGGSITNYALFGVDDRGDTTEGRSDSIMILTVDTKHNKIKLTSILRDSRVTINGSLDKITHAYAYGGAQLAVKTINENFGLNIKDYATVNFARMAEIVNAFGGSAVTISDAEVEQMNGILQSMRESDPELNVTDSDYMSQSGSVLLNGNQAVAYSRIRYLEGGDDMRAIRQQNVITGMLGRIKDLSYGDYVNLIRTIAPLTVTSVDAGDVIPMIPFVMGGFSMETLKIPGDAENAQGGSLDNGAWVYIYDLDQASQHIDAFIRETDSPYYNTYFGGESQN